MKSLEMNHDAMEISTAKRKYYPSLSISAKTIPELADLKDGETCIIKLKVKKTGSHSNNNHTTVNLDAMSGEYCKQ